MRLKLVESNSKEKQLFIEDSVSSDDLRVLVTGVKKILEQNESAVELIFSSVGEIDRELQATMNFLSQHYPQRIRFRFLVLEKLMQAVAALETEAKTLEDQLKQTDMKEILRLKKENSVISAQIKAMQSRNQALFAFIKNFSAPALVDKKKHLQKILLSVLSSDGLIGKDLASKLEAGL